jgi:hypothetical protein
MTGKNKLPSEAPTFPAGEWMAGLATGSLCLISALALAYHVWDTITVSHWAVKVAFTVLSGVFAFLMGLVPMTLAKAHGSALEGSNAQSGLMFIVVLFMAVDGALLVHAAQYLQKLMGMTPMDMVWVIPLVAAFEIAAFFVRGQLYAASKEIQELIDAREHHLKEVAAHAKARELAKRREKYAENRNVVNMR